MKSMLIARFQIKNGDFNVEKINLKLYRIHSGYGSGGIIREGDWG